MSKRAERRNTQQQPKNRSKRESLLQVTEQDEHRAPPRKRNPNPLTPLTEAQRLLMAAVQANDLTFILGPVGTGKTYVAGRMAARELDAKKIDRIIITRPAVEACGENLGFLPGTLDEKFEPYLEPVRDAFEDELGSGFVDYLIAKEKIVPKPLAFMRGHDFKDAWVILDEAQNTTPAQMYLFLTRIGRGSKVIVNGDPMQKDIKGRCGLLDALSKTRGLKGVTDIAFTRDDIVRSGLVQQIAERYADYDDTADNREDEKEDRDQLPAFLRTGAR